MEIEEDIVCFSWGGKGVVVKAAAVLMASRKGDVVGVGRFPGIQYSVSAKSMYVTINLS